MPRNPHDVPCTFVTEPHQLVEIEHALHGAQRVAIDTEVPIDGPRKHLLRVMSMAVRRGDGSEVAFVVDARDVDPTLLGPILDGITADAWNANFDARVLDAAIWQSSDTTPGLRWWDAQIADALIHQGRSGFNWFHGLAWATGHYLGIEAEGKGTVQLSYTAFDDLTSEQVAYAAADAVETLWVADAIRHEVNDAGLNQICEIEMEARPLLDRMERVGLPFDAKGWRAELNSMAQRHRDTLGRLATLTGGGQGSLFDETIEPTWNPASERHVRQALNRWSTAEVHAWTEQRHGTARPLNDLDSVTAGVLRDIGGELCETLLEFRSLSKIISTYGESILEHLDDDGRMRPQYLQVVGTNTGRLASRNPNAQNFTPLMKPYVRPADPDRVFVHADLSQAELRYLAQVANDAPLRAAFARGDDVHVTTAATMFGFDRDQLAIDDPARFKHLRQIAKALNFGIAYGTGAAALSRSLTSEGSPTTVDEAKQLLAQYRQTYPGTAAWAEERIAEIQDVREDTIAIDWPLTLRLARGFPAVRDVRRHFRRTENRWPTAAEIVERLPDNDRLSDVDGHDQLAEVEWLLAYSAPVALNPDGTPFTFASRTLAGRRQQFNLHLDRLFLSAVIEAVADPSPAAAATRRRFEAAHDLDLWPNLEAPSDKEISLCFEDRSLRLRFIEMLAEDQGADAADARLRRAARERASVMVNAWRNAPIQGGVADIMLAAYGDLHARLAGHPSAVPIQTVHDSIVVECAINEAEAVAASVRLALEEASLRFCPDVAPKADVDIRRSLADADIIETAIAAPSVGPTTASTRTQQSDQTDQTDRTDQWRVDRAHVRAKLEANRAIHFYGLGDLADLFWDRSRWWERDGALIGEIGLSDNPLDRTVYAINAQHTDAALELWRDIDHVLPDRYLATGVFGFPDVLAAQDRIVEEDLGHHTKMLLTNRSALAASTGTPTSAELGVRQLTSRDLPAIDTLRAANPDTGAFFATHLLDLGPFFGVFAGDALVAMAGVHVCDTEISVAAIGGVLTDAAHRGRVHAHATTAAVAQSLLDMGITTIGLNVPTANDAARSVYAALGFRDVHTYQEALLVRRS